MGHAMIRNQTLEGTSLADWSNRAERVSHFDAKGKDPFVE